MPQPPPIPSELEEGVVDELTRSAKEHHREVVSDESGRTLTVTLHEVRSSVASCCPARIGPNENKR